MFEEGAGPVAVAIRCRDGRPVECELTAPQSPARDAPVEAVAESVGLSPDVVVTRTHPPRVASAGLPFLCVELRDRTALAEARVRHDPHAALMRSSGAEGILLYTRDTGEGSLDLRAHVRASPWRRGGSGHRQRQPGPRRPARASAPEADGAFAWHIAQGVEMGRASLLEASAIKRGGAVATLRIGGRSVLVCDGWIETGAAPG